MGWFDEQIRLRKLNDEELLEESFLDMAGAVMGVEMQASLESNRIRTKNAIDAILQSMHVRSRDIPDDVTDLNDLQRWNLHLLIHSPGGVRGTFAETNVEGSGYEILNTGTSLYLWNGSKSGGTTIFVR